MLGRQFKFWGGFFCCFVIFSNCFIFWEGLPWTQTTYAILYVKKKNKKKPNKKPWQNPKGLKYLWAPFLKYNNSWFEGVEREVRSGFHFFAQWNLNSCYMKYLIFLDCQEVGEKQIHNHKTTRTIFIIMDGFQRQS